MKRVTPLVIKYRESQLDTLGTVSPTYDTCEFFPMTILTLCLLPCFYGKITKLPDFEPNDYLFEQHKDKGAEKWEIFAWAVRDIMIKEGGFIDHHLTWRHKIQYEKYM